MKKEFIKMIENMTDEAFVRVLGECGCPKHYGLEEYRELCEDDKNNCIVCWRDALNCKETKTTFKTWEMIRELTENPKKVFMRDYDELVVKVDKTTETLSWESGHEHLCIDDEWEEVKQPVSWQEALGAWANGAAVKCEINDGSGFTLFYKGNLYPEDGDEIALCSEEILKGTWYILDEEEVK